MFGQSGAALFVLENGWVLPFNGTPDDSQNERLSPLSAIDAIMGHKNIEKILYMSDKAWADYVDSQGELIPIDPPEGIELNEGERFRYLPITPELEALAIHTHIMTDDDLNYEEMHTVLQSDDGYLFPFAPSEDAEDLLRWKEMLENGTDKTIVSHANIGTNSLPVIDREVLMRRYTVWKLTPEMTEALIDPTPF